MKRLPKASRVSNGLTRLLAYSVVATLFAAILLPSAAFAAQIDNRKLTLGSSQSNTATTWTFQFNPAATTALNGITFQVCDAASGSCVAPGSWTNAGSAFSSLTYNGSSQSGWALDNAAGYLRIKNNASATATSSPIVATFNTVTNPNTTNATFFVRINTYTGDDYTGALDSGVVAASTASQIALDITNPESLVFCVGTSITGQDCGTISGSTLSLPAASSTATRSGTSVMAASTNGVSGYSITISGSTLTCGTCSGTPTIPALASQTASTIGTSQFGTNLKANTTPSVGAEVSGSGSGTAAANYGTANQYRFVSGDSVSSAAAATNANTFTTSYIVNVSGSQAAGSYSATFTYTATALF
jgi:hypothetical protein